MLRDPKRSKAHSAVVEAMTEIGGPDVGEELTSLLDEELAFWRATGPGLKRGWWNHVAQPETEDLRDRYMKLYAALLGLKKLGHEGSHAAVAELRDFWHLWPQLDEVGTDPITAACDEILGGRGDSPTRRR
jgi:hypothetical protein